jgi:cholesterol transport system auxiliary component
MNPNKRRAAAAVLAMLLLAACTGVLPGAGPAPTLFTLTPKNTFRADLAKVGWQLVVEEPLAAGGLDTNKIAVMPNALELQYYADARWTERAPRMVQTLLVESFENTGKIVAVGRQAVGLRSDFNLKSELREFQTEYRAGETAPRVRVRLNVKLIEQPRQEIIASRNFEHVEQPKSAAMPDVIDAFDEALGKVLRRTVEWTLATAEEARRR